MSARKRGSLFGIPWWVHAYAWVLGAMSGLSTYLAAR